MAEDQPETVSLYQQMDQESLSLDSSFTFHCHADLPCFNQCCRTPTVILSPYDLLRLKQGLGITSTALRERYTRQEIEPNSNLPLVFIDAYRSPEGGCPFLGGTAARFIPIGRRPAASFPSPWAAGSPRTASRTITFAAGWIIAGASMPRSNGRWPPGWPTRDLPSMTRGAGHGSKSC